MALRPVVARAAATAIRFASVPELQNRTRSMDGKRWQMISASRASFSLGPPKDTPRSIRFAHCGKNHRMRVAKKPRCVFTEQINILMLIEIPKACTRALGDGERKGRVMEHRPGVAA